MAGSSDDIQLKSSPWWWEDAPPQDIPILRISNENDVIIVGAGYTGLTAAITLVREGRSVLVIDANRPGSGASTRNGGMIGSGHKVGFDSLRKRFGKSLAIDLLREGSEALSFTGNFIQEEKLNCDFRRCGRFRAAWNKTHFESMAKDLEAMRKYISLDAEVVPHSEQHLQVNTDSYQGGCIYHQHGSLHPARFHRELLNLTISLGVTLLPDNPVIRIEKDGKRFKVSTAMRSFFSDDVILATNGYRDTSMPELCRRVVPVHSFIVATESLDEGVPQSLIPGGRMIVESRSRHCYYRISPDGKRLLFGGRAAVQALRPKQSAKILHALMLQLFPVLDGVKVTHSWSGKVAISQDGIPHIGRLKSGEYFATAYNGSGIAMAPYLGYKIAHAVLGNPEGKTPFAMTPFPRIPVYFGKPWFLPIVNIFYRHKDRLEGSL